MKFSKKCKNLINKKESKKRNDTDQYDQESMQES